jgi:hypothetical protein
MRSSMPAQPARRATATHCPRLSLGRRVAIRTLVRYLIAFAILRVITAIIQFDVFLNGPFHFVMTTRPRLGQLGAAAERPQTSSCPADGRARNLPTC